MIRRTMNDDATELKIFIDNDGDLYRQQTTSILKNLATKRARGIYKHDLAVKLFGYLVESGAKKYAKDFGGTWHEMFPVSTRKQVAEALTQAFESEAELGNYDGLLPKKYQGADKTSAGKKSPAQLDADIVKALGKKHCSKCGRGLRKPQLAPHERELCARCGG